MPLTEKVPLRLVKTPLRTGQPQSQARSPLRLPQCPPPITVPPSSHPIRSRRPLPRFLRWPRLHPLPQGMPPCRLSRQCSPPLQSPNRRSHRHRHPRLPLRRRPVHRVRLPLVPVHPLPLPPAILALGVMHHPLRNHPESRPLAAACSPGGRCNQCLVAAPIFTTKCRDSPAVGKMRRLSC